LSTHSRASHRRTLTGTVVVASVVALAVVSAGTATATTTKSSKPSKTKLKREQLAELINQRDTRVIHSVDEHYPYQRPERDLIVSARLAGPLDPSASKTGQVPASEANFRKHFSALLRERFPSGGDDAQVALWADQQLRGNPHVWEISASANLRDAFGEFEKVGDTYPQVYSWAKKLIAEGDGVKGIARLEQTDPLPPHIRDQLNRGFREATEPQPEMPTPAGKPRYITVKVEDGKLHLGDVKKLRYADIYETAKLPMWFVRTKNLTTRNLTASTAAASNGPLGHPSLPDRIPHRPLTNRRETEEARETVTRLRDLEQELRANNIPISIDPDLFGEDNYYIRFFAKDPVEVTREALRRIVTQRIQPIQDGEGDELEYEYVVTLDEPVGYHGGHLQRPTNQVSVRSTPAGLVASLLPTVD
jgi:hypothetical protein